MSNDIDVPTGNERIKFMLLNPLSKENVAARERHGKLERLWSKIISAVCVMFPGVEEAEINKEAQHLVETKQVIVEDGVARLGNVLFEHAALVSDKANEAAKAIYENLLDRRGIRHVLEDLDNDVTLELLNTMAKLIDEVFNVKN